MVFDWNHFFDQVFKTSKTSLKCHYKLFEDESDPEDLIAFNKAIDSLPLEVNILELHLNKEKHPDFRDDTIQWIKFDIAKLNSAKTTYYGKVEFDNESEVINSLATAFSLSSVDAKKIYEIYAKDFSTISLLDEQMYVKFCRRDITKPQDKLTNIEAFVNDFLLDFTTGLGEAIIHSLGEPTGNHLRYKTYSDEILSLDQIIKNRGSYPVATLESLQERICDINLLDSVPEHVQRTFQNAKKLYVSGYFYYNFFTISRHYACLALEAAVKHRYMQSLPSEIGITDKNGKLKHVSKNHDYERILSFAYKNRVHPSILLLNGKEFPHNKGKLIGWLKNNGILSIYESKICSMYLEERNRLSHLTFAPIHTPATDYFIRIANLINKMFDANKS